MTGPTFFTLLKKVLICFSSRARLTASSVVDYGNGTYNAQGLAALIALLSGGVFERCGAPKQYVEGLSRPHQFLLRDDMSAETRTKKNLRMRHASCACSICAPGSAASCSLQRRLPAARTSTDPYGTAGARWEPCAMAAPID